MVPVSEEKVMLSGRVPKELKELVDADRRDNQEIMRAALWREFGGQRLADIERRIEEKERRREIVKKERENRDNELEELNSELAALKSKKSSEQSEKEALLSDAQDALEGIPLNVDNPAVENWAGKLDMEPAELIDELGGETDDQ